MTPIDVILGVTIALLVLALITFVLGIVSDSIGEGVALSLVFFGMAFITFVLYAILWVIYQAVT
jgi:hypothetical protein